MTETVQPLPLEEKTWKRQGAQVMEKRQHMAEYVEWASTPEKAREPRRKKDFAESIGVTLRTLNNYDKDRWVQAELVKRQKGAFKVKRVQDVIDHQFLVATGKVGESVAASVSAAKLLLDWSDRSVETQEFDGESMTDDELRAVARAIEQAFAEEA